MATVSPPANGKWNTQICFLVSVQSMASAITVQRKQNVALWKNWRGELGKSGRMSASSCEMCYLFIEKPSFCDVALIRPGLAPGPPSP